MHPEIHINWPAIIAAMASNIVIGFLWYGPIFGKAWMAEMKVPPDFKPAPGVLRKAMTLMVLGSFLTAYVLAHDVQIWRPSTWHAGEDMSDASYGFWAAFFIWLGFYVPVLFNQVAWEGKSWKLFGINASCYFVSLQAAAMILSYWR